MICMISDHDLDHPFPLDDVDHPFPLHDVDIR